MSIQHTTEFAAASHDVIWAVVDELRSSPRKRLVFHAVYSGGNKPKDAKFLAAKTGLAEVVVPQLATPGRQIQAVRRKSHGVSYA